MYISERFDYFGVECDTNLNLYQYIILWEKMKQFENADPAYDVFKLGVIL